MLQFSLTELQPRGCSPLSHGATTPWLSQGNETFFEWNAGLGKNKQTCAKIEDLRSIPRYCNSDHVLIILKQQIY